MNVEKTIKRRLIRETEAKVAASQKEARDRAIIDRMLRELEEEGSMSFESGSVYAEALLAMAKAAGWK